MIAGRGETLRRFIAHIEAAPSPGLSEVWFQNEASDWEAAARRTERQTRTFLDGFETNVQISADWLPEIETLARAQGLVQGTGDELQSLYRQALAYHTDLQAAETQDQYARLQREKALAALSAASAYYKQVNYQQELLNALNRPRTCRVVGGFVSCF